MKKTFLIILTGFSLISCDKILKQNNDSQIESKENTFQEKVGGDEDEHGCISSAGYTWSNLREDCVQLFEVAYRLNPVSDPTNDDATDAAIISAFVLFNDNESELELFLPEIQSGIIIAKNKEGKYQKDNYLFDKEHFVLYIHGKKSYQAAEYEPKDITDIGE